MDYTIGDRMNRFNISKLNQNNNSHLVSLFADNIMTFLSKNNNLIALFQLLKNRAEMLGLSSIQKKQKSFLLD